MAFLDNSGDIILDAVLTDTGRFRLAKGDGTFKIAKFALGDDEIDYGTYNKNHASGSAYYDLQILQTPVLEAFTNNTSLLKSKLMSIPRTNLLYLPSIQVNTTDNIHGSPQVTGISTFYITVDENTTNAFTANVNDVKGIIEGDRNPTRGIILDQGLDTTEIPPTFTLDADLVETQYIIEMDNRFGSLISLNNEQAAVSFIDDDNIASYYLSLGANPAHVAGHPGAGRSTNQFSDTPIDGPRGTQLKFSIRASIELNSSTFLFTKLGSTSDSTTTGHTQVSATASPSYTGFYYIDTTIRITGATTGYRIDVPVRFVKVYT